MAIDEQVLINIEANTEDASSHLEELILEMGRLSRAINDLDTNETARHRKNQQNAKARQAQAKAEIAQQERLIAKIEQAAAVQIANHAKNQENAKARIAQEKRLQAEIERTANEMKAKQSSAVAASRALERTHDAAIAHEKRLQAEIERTANEEQARNAVAIREIQERENKFRQMQQTAREEIKKTRSVQEDASRKELELLRQQEAFRERAYKINRDQFARVEAEKDRALRREELQEKKLAREQRDRLAAQRQALGDQTRSLTTVRRHTDGIGASVGRWRSQLTIVSALIGHDIFYGLGRVLRRLVEVTQNFERLRLGLAAVEGSTEVADAQVRTVRRLALLPGVQFEPGLRTVTRLRGAGISFTQSERLIREISNFAALAGASAEDVGEAMRQIQQIVSVGRFQTENLRPIFERIPQLRRVFQEEFGVSLGEQVQSVIEAQGVTITEALNKILTRAELSPRAPETTLANAIERLMDNVDDLLRGIGSDLLPLMKATINGLSSLLKWLNDNRPLLYAALGVGTTALARRFIVGRAAGAAAQQAIRSGPQNIGRTRYATVLNEYSDGYDRWATAQRTQRGAKAAQEATEVAGAVAQATGLPGWAWGAGEAATIGTGYTLGRGFYLNKDLVTQLQRQSAVYEQMGQGKLTWNDYRQIFRGQDTPRLRAKLTGPAVDGFSDWMNQQPLNRRQAIRAASLAGQGPGSKVLRGVTHPAVGSIGGLVLPTAALFAADAWLRGRSASGAEETTTTTTQEKETKKEVEKTYAQLTRKDFVKQTQERVDAVLELSGQTGDKLSILRQVILELTRSFSHLNDYIKQGIADETMSPGEIGYALDGSPVLTGKSGRVMFASQKALLDWLNREKNITRGGEIVGPDVTQFGIHSEVLSGLSEAYHTARQQAVEDAKFEKTQAEAFRKQINQAITDIKSIPELRSQRVHEDVFLQALGAVPTDILQQMVGEISLERVGELRQTSEGRKEIYKLLEDAAKIRFLDIPIESLQEALQLPIDRIKELLGTDKGVQEIYKLLGEQGRIRLDRFSTEDLHKMLNLSEENIKALLLLNNGAAELQKVLTPGRQDERTQLKPLFEALTDEQITQVMKALTDVPLAEFKQFTGKGADKVYLSQREKLLQLFDNFPQLSEKQRTDIKTLIDTRKSLIELIELSDQLLEDSVEGAKEINKFLVERAKRFRPDFNIAPGAAVYDPKNLRLKPKDPNLAKKLLVAGEFDAQGNPVYRYQHAAADVSFRYRRAQMRDQMQYDLAKLHPTAIRGESIAGIHPSSMSEQQRKNYTLLTQTMDDVLSERGLSGGRLFNESVMYAKRSKKLIESVLDFANSYVKVTPEIAKATLSMEKALQDGFGETAKYLDKYIKSVQKASDKIRSLVGEWRSLQEEADKQRDIEKMTGLSLGTPLREIDRTDHLYRIGELKHMARSLVDAINQFKALGTIGENFDIKSSDVEAAFRSIRPTGELTEEDQRVVALIDQISKLESGDVIPEDINMIFDGLREAIEALAMELQLSRDAQKDQREIDIDERIRSNVESWRQSNPDQLPDSNPLNLPNLNQQQIYNHPYFKKVREQATREEEKRLEDLKQAREKRAGAVSQYFASATESLYDQFVAPSILDMIPGVESAATAQRKRALEQLKQDIEQQRQDIANDEVLSERQKTEQLLEINRDYEEEKRDIQRQYEEERSDAWKAWVRQQLTDFPKLIFQQLNLQLAARATNKIFQMLGISGGVPITGPGIADQGQAINIDAIGRFRKDSGSYFERIGRFLGIGSTAQQSQIFQGYNSPIGPQSAGMGGAPMGMGSSGLQGAGIGGSGVVAGAAKAGAAAGFALAAHNIATGTIPGLNPHGQSLFDDFGGDLLAATGTKTFFDNLHFNNPENDAFAHRLGRMRSMAKTYGRESAYDLAKHYDKGRSEGNQSQDSPFKDMIVFHKDAQIDLNVNLLDDSGVQKISFKIDELKSQGRL